MLYSIQVAVRDKSQAVRCGSIAQLGEHLPYKQRVTGSSPVVPTINGPVVQLVRTLACHARGRRFEPVPGRHLREFNRVLVFASVAQLVEQRTENPRVVGSIPTGGTKNADVAHLVERHLAKVEVASSSLVIRSKKSSRNSERIFLSKPTGLVYHHRAQCGVYHQLALRVVYHHALGVYSLST